MHATASANRSHCAALVRTLLAGGARHVVVSPGSRSTPLVLAFAAERAAAMHTVLDERSAGFFALGLAKASGAPAVLLCTSGSAGLHYGPAVAEAAHSDVPLVVLTADRPPELHGCDAPQTLDQTRLFGAHVAFFANLSVPEPQGTAHAWCLAAARALDAAVHGAAPVHLNVPMREPLWHADLPAEPPAAGRPPPRRVRGGTVVPADCMAALADVMATRSRGVIVCGPRRPAPAGGAEADGDAAFAAAVAELAVATGWPVLAETASNMRWGASCGPHGVAAYDALLRDPQFRAEHRPDFVLRLGGPPTSKSINRWLQDAAEAPERDMTALFSVAVRPGMPGSPWPDPTGSVDMVLALPEAEVCRAITRALPGRTGAGVWQQSWAAAERRAQEALDAACAAGGWSGRLCRALIDALPHSASLHVASSMPIRDLDAFAPVSDKAVRVFCNRGLNGIDGTLATLFGEALAGFGPMVGLVGDLAFLHDASALALAPQLQGRQITVVVVNNGGGAIFDHLAIAEHPTAFETFFRTPQPQDIAAVCRGWGIGCTVIDGAGDVRRALAQHVGKPGVHVVEVRMSQEGLAHHLAAWQKVGAALVDGRKA